MTPEERRRDWQRDLALVCVGVVVLLFYAWKCHEHPAELGNATPAEAYYNLLVEGFRHGQLNMAIATPPGLAQLADPWDPDANLPFRKGVYSRGRLHDASYYHGKLYLYFSATPAVLLFWPYHALTGRYLEHATAVMIFCSAAFGIAVGVWRAIARRYFPELSLPIVAGCALALGMANSVAVMIERPDVWEVPISCGLMFTMVTLAALWRALHEPARVIRWLAIAASAFALAVSARPSLLPIAPVLVLPLLAMRRSGATLSQRGQRVGALLAITIPLVLIGTAVAAYNHARFGSVFEFGQRYQLAGDRQTDPGHFALRHVWYNFRLYFFSLAPWSAEFPFVKPVAVPPPPAGHGAVDLPFGILVNTPVTLFAVALPWGWRQWRERARALRWFVAVVGIAFIVPAALFCAFYGVATRYQAEFHPPLMLLAVIGVGAVWQTLRVRTPRLLGLAAAVFGATLLYSVTCSVLIGFDKTLDRLSQQGLARYASGDFRGALAAFERACRLSPQFVVGWFNVGVLHQQLGEIEPASAAYQQCLRLAPTHVTARSNYAMLLRGQGRFPEAMAQLEEAVRINAGAPDLRFNLGLVYRDAGQLAKAIESLQEAIRLKQDFAEAHYYLALTLLAANRADEARRHYVEARRLQPSLPELRF